MAIGLLGTIFLPRLGLGDRRRPDEPGKWCGIWNSVPRYGANIEGDGVTCAGVFGPGMPKVTEK